MLVKIWLIAYNVSVLKSPLIFLLRYIFRPQVETTTLVLPRLFAPGASHYPDSLAALGFEVGRRRGHATDLAGNASWGRVEAANRGPSHRRVRILIREWIKAKYIWGGNSIIVNSRKSLQTNTIFLRMVARNVWSSKGTNFWPGRVRFIYRK